MRERERGEIRVRVRGGSVGRSSVLDLRLGRAKVVHSAKLCNTRVAGLRAYIELKLFSEVNHSESGQISCHI